VELGGWSGKGWPRVAGRPKMGGMNHSIAQVFLASILGLVSVLSSPIGLPAAEPAAPAKPVFLYSRL